MKKLNIFILILVAVFNVNTPMFAVQREPCKEDPEKIDLGLENKGGNIEGNIEGNIDERSLSAMQIEAYIYRNKVYVQISNIGEAIITISDSNGNLVYEQSLFVNSYSVQEILLPLVPNNYSIVISTDNIYAIGYFNIY